MDKESITRYVRPEDIPLMDQAILEPIVTSVAKEMSQSHPEQTVEEWIVLLQKALLRGDIMLVIDDHGKRMGLVRTDEPPFSGLVHGAGGSGPVQAADPLNIKKWETDSN